MRVCRMTDFKLGYCRKGLWLHYAFCCDTEADINNPIDGSCPNWVTWVEAVGIVRARGARSACACRSCAAQSYRPNERSAWWYAYLFYVSWGVFFAVLSAWLVRSFAPYARGSGADARAGGLLCAESARRRRYPRGEDHPERRGDQALPGLVDAHHQVRGCHPQVRTRG